MTTCVDELLRTYGCAWENRDAELVLTLFTDDATYQESPWSEPLLGKEAIRQYWLTATSPQRDIHFELGDVHTCAEHVYAEWRCRYVRARSGRACELRGILILELRDGRIARLREYWHRREE